ncbi:hypothetical protein D9M72_600420 [compost metagenome]
MKREQWLRLCAHIPKLAKNAKQRDIGRQAVEIDQVLSRQLARSTGGLVQAVQLRDLLTILRTAIAGLRAREKAA